MVGATVIVGHDQVFTLYDARNLRPQTLLSTADVSLRFLQRPLDVGVELLPVACFALPAQACSPGEGIVDEFVLCFNLLCFFVNQAGLRSRTLELIFSAPVHSFVFLYPYLLGYTGNFVEVLHVESAARVGSFPLEEARWLSHRDPLCLTSNSGVGQIVLLQDQRLPPLQKMPRSQPEKLLSAPVDKDDHRRRYSSRSKQRPKGEQWSVSVPLDFKHVVHISPSAVEQRLVEKVHTSRSEETVSSEQVPLIVSPVKSDTSSGSLHQHRAAQVRTLSAGEGVNARG